MEGRRGYSKQRITLSGCRIYRAEGEQGHSRAQQEYKYSQRSTSPVERSPAGLQFVTPPDSLVWVHLNLTKSLLQKQ
jgi:hypothetical protein